MKQLTMAALMLILGVASLYAQQRPVKMSYSGSMVATTIDLAPNTITDEEHLGGNGTLGQFTFRKLRTDETTPTFGSCGSGFGPSFRVVTGGGVFRFEDGSLLTVKLMEGVLCVDVSDMSNLVGHLTETYQITGGTGRFKGASASCGAMAQTCTLKSTGTLAAVLFDASGAAPKLLTNTGEFEGTVSGLAIGAARKDERQ